MKIKKQIGVWMDNSSANIIELVDDRIEDITVTSEFTHEERVQSLKKSEHLMHNKEQDQQLNYYKKIELAISDCDALILFGPTTAKAELYNLLKLDVRFNKIKVDVRDSDKLTENQRHAYVRAFFQE